MDIPLLESSLGFLSLTALSLAVLGGAITAFVRLADINTPFDTGLLHGGMGISGVILLLLLLLIGQQVDQAVSVALGLLLMTILGGATLYFVIRRKGILPKSIILLHALFALGAMHVLTSLIK